MKWLDDPPEDWDDAPEHPPTAPGESTGDDGHPEPVGFAVHDPEIESDGAYIYAWDGSVSLEERA